VASAEIERLQFGHRTVHVFDSLSDASAAVATEIISLIEGLLSVKRTCTVALSGGSTPRELYSILSSDYRERDCWKYVTFLLVDERLVPESDDASNAGMIRKLLIQPLGLKDEQFLHPNTSLAHDECTYSYAAKLTMRMGETPSIDLILLGMGADGHTASIFPPAVSTEGSDPIVIATTAPVQPQDRISITMQTINRASCVLFLVAGQDKERALKQVFKDNMLLPAARVVAQDETAFFIDRKAFPPS